MRCPLTLSEPHLSKGLSLKKGLIALALMASLAMLAYSVAGIFAQQEVRFEEPSRIFHLAKIYMGPGAIESAEPTGWSVVRIWGTIPPYTVWWYGPYYPTAIYVCIDSETPDIGLSVTIFVGGAPRWAGTLCAGQCSPTVTANGLETYVSIANGFGVSITFAGRILLYSP